MQRTLRNMRHPIGNAVGILYLAYWFILLLICIVGVCAAFFVTDRTRKILRSICL